jgi:hypothetical protein
MAQAQPPSKRTRRTKSVKPEQGSSHLSDNIVGPGQPLGPYYNSHNHSFPLDPALTLQEHNEEWADWVNYGAVLLREIEADGSSSSVFGPAGGRLVGRSPITSEQTLIHPYGEAFGPSQHALHPQGSSAIPLPTEVEDHLAKPNRKRRKTNKD